MEPRLRLWLWGQRCDAVLLREAPPGARPVAPPVWCAGGPEDVGAEVELGPREDLFESEDAIHPSEEDSLFNFRGHLHYYTIVLPLSFNILQT